MQIISPNSIQRQSTTKNLSSLRHLPELIQRIYAARGISELAQLDKQLPSLLPYHSLLNIEKVSQIIAQAIQQQQRILVVGDYDVDGATSVALMVLGVRALGGKIDHLVPNRFTYGYGLTPPLVDLAIKKYAPELLITVDNGITSLAGAAYCQQQQIGLIITDHHLAGPELPVALGIVNPNQPGDQFPSKNLAGVGVAFYVLLAVRAQLKNSGWFTEQGIPAPNFANFLDLVALGTVADVVTLDHNNRILVHQGLQRIRAGHCRPGIKALLQVARRELAWVNTGDLGFALGPRLNAAGRLEDMSLGVECLLAEDLTAALAMAAQLDQLNQERKSLEEEMCQAALWLTDKIIVEQAAAEIPVAFCLFQAEWHQGVIGIVASRIKERFHRPVIIFARENDEMLKGSGRSIPGIDLKSVLQIIDAEQPGLIAKFGGHTMAAGLSLARDKLAQFQAAFSATVARIADPQVFQVKILSDGELSLSDFNLDLALQLAELEPWGQNFPEPVFDGEFWAEGGTVINERHLKLRLRIPNTQKTVLGILFNAEDQLKLDNLPAKVKLVYQLQVNRYQGKMELQLLIQQLWPV